MNLRVFQILFILWCTRVGGMEELQGEMEELQGEMEELQGEMEELQGEMEELQGEMEELQGEMKELKGEMKELKGEMKELQGEMEEELEKMADNIPQQILKAEVKSTKEKGIDVSNWQKIIDWNLVAKSGIKHAFIKMSEGKNFADPYFVKNWNGAQKAGINVNCYHYFRAPTPSPGDQLKNIKKTLNLVKFNAAKNALAIDAELTGNGNATATQMADNLNALLTLIKKDPDLSKMPLLIYTSSGYWNSKVNWRKYDFSAYGLWVAHWNAKTPVLPEPWKSKNKKWVWWQYSSKGKINGIRGDVDLDWVMV